MPEHMTNCNSDWNGKVELFQNHTNRSSYQLSISSTFLPQRIGKLHYFPYLAFLSVLFLSIIQFYTLSIRFINYSLETAQSILLWQNKNQKYDQHNIHFTTICFWITNVVTYWIWFTDSIGTNTSVFICSYSYSENEIHTLLSSIYTQ